MNRLDRWMLAVAILSTILALLGHNPVANDYYMRQMGDGSAPIWMTGWLIGTYGPAAMGALSWRRSKRSAVPWLYHLLLLLGMCLLLAGGERLMLLAISDPDFDATLGAPISPAVLAFVLAIGGYLAAVILRGFGGGTTQAHDRQADGGVA